MLCHYIALVHSNFVSFYTRSQCWSYDIDLVDLMTKKSMTNVYILHFTVCSFSLRAVLYLPYILLNRSHKMKWIDHFKPSFSCSKQFLSVVQRRDLSLFMPSQINPLAPPRAKPHWTNTLGVLGLWIVKNLQQICK